MRCYNQLGTVPYAELYRQMTPPESDQGWPELHYVFTALRATMAALGDRAITIGQALQAVDDIEDRLSGARLASSSQGEPTT